MAVSEHLHRGAQVILQGNDSIEAHEPSVEPKKKKKLKRGKMGKDALKKKKKIKKQKTTVEDSVVAEGNGTEDAPLRGMKKWLADYHSQRPGLDVLQQRIDAFIIDHEAREEKARKEREAAAAAEGWTVVVHQKGRKKTTDADTGITVGAVAQVAAQERNSKKKAKEAALDFYRFQRRDARRNEILELQKKFDDDKKRISEMRAARKFRPY